jgi:serine/threonine-protein kinase
VNLIGQRIGSYIVERELGAGGTGTVYACRHTMIDREVAVKILHDQQAGDPDQVARFFQEAKSAADIGHPNIIIIIDYGTLELPSGSRTYVMMESLSGQSLDKRMRRGGLSLEDIRHVLTQVASALVACHGKAIIHRDLKPSNIFLCERSFDPMFVKVLDFGTAKLAAPTPGLRRTQLGVVIGTPAYMSPEQCEGKGALDHRSDIYSLGAMLYEMLTGALPHDGDLGDILLGHMYRAPVPPRERNPSIPPEWEALCLRMMEKAREARFQSVTDLAHALDDLRSHAAAYEEARARRADSSHSGHTLVTSAPGGPPGQPSNDSRPTLHVDLGTGPHANPLQQPPYTSSQPAYPQTPPPLTTSQPAYPQAPPPLTTSQPQPQLPSPQSPQQPFTTSSFFDLRGPCSALVVDPRHSAFPRILMTRPPGRWFELSELCAVAHVAPPASIAHDLGMFVAWVEHPYPDPNLAAVIFLSLRSSWSTVVLCPRVR